MINRKGFFWQLYPSLVFLTVISVGALTWYTYRTLSSFYIKQVTSELLSRARMAASAFVRGRYPLQTRVVDAFCDDLGKASHTRFTFILPSGKVIGDTERDPQTMDNHSDRPEIVQATEQGFGKSKRFSFTLHKDMMYVAVPLAENGKTQVIVRAAIPVESIGSVLKGPRKTIVLVSLFILFLAGVISYFISRRMCVPIIRMQKAADSISEGNLATKVSVSAPDEIAKLAGSINKMVETLRHQVQQATEHRNQLEAIFDNMDEGVVALDGEERIVSINPAALEMLYLRGNVEGKLIQEVFRVTELYGFIDKVSQSGRPDEMELALKIGGEERLIRIRSTIMPGDSEGRHGILLVLHDITSMKRLENIRRDFVANVSHELKTPITAIKGALETLQEVGAHGHEELSRFLQMIRRNADRLESIVEDLLKLSRLEQDQISGKMPFEKVNLVEVLGSAIAACKELAQVQGMELELHCDKDLMVMANSRLLEQAVVNLLDNAIKYSEKGGKVEVEAEELDGKVEIRVKDEGVGIEKEHLPRIFERFYRIDKARSRAQGGTGLGLAIVKHVAQIHGGTVKVASQIGKGSTFSIILPS